jgi:hypothetical protein
MPALTYCQQARSAGGLAGDWTAAEPPAVRRRYVDVDFNFYCAGTNVGSCVF